MSLGPQQTDTEAVVQELREKVSTIETRFHPSGSLELTAAYLHGSLGAGQATDVSDVDVVVAVEAKDGSSVSRKRVTKRLQFGSADVVAASGLPIRAVDKNADIIARTSPEEALETAKSFSRAGGYSTLYDLINEREIPVSE